MMMKKRVILLLVLLLAFSGLTARADATGYADILLSDLSAIPEERQDSILMIYAKTRISTVMQNAADSGCPVVMLLNPDCYAMYLDRARHLGITLLLMPAPPYALLDAVQEASSS